MNKPLGLYVHIPFCQTKCAYCDFVSYPGQEALKAPLVRGLLAEADLKGLGRDHLPTTLYLGGGTPTSLGLGPMETLLSGLDQRVGLDRLEEITVEANPKGLTLAMASLLKAYGVTRVSLGVQSFSPASLRVLGRDQDPEDPARAVALLRQAGIDQVNLDLIYGLPGQDLRAWQEDLEKALALGPDHLSLYQLGVSSHTHLGRALRQGLLPPIAEDLGADAWDWHISYLAEEGFRHYEISNYAKVGCESRHNLIYWRTQDYLALGPSATQWVRPQRSRNRSDLLAYLRALAAGHLPPREVEALSPEDQKVESLLMGLRLQEGVDKEAYTDRYGQEPAARFGPAIRRLEGMGLLEEGSSHLSLTPKGAALGNLVFMELL